jgi:hypothetical protein
MPGNGLGGAVRQVTGAWNGQLARLGAGGQWRPLTSPYPGGSLSSPSTSYAVFRPLIPITLPPGWVAAPQR